MKKLLLLGFLFFACSPKTGFNAFFDKEVPHADQALDLPKWLPMIAIPKSAKEDVKRLSQGMKKVKLLRYTKDQEGGEDRFKNYTTSEELYKYLEILDAGNSIQVMSKEVDEAFREILFSIKTDEEYVIFGMTGKMSKIDFQNALAEINDRRNE